MIADPHLNAFDSRVQMSYALSRNGLQRILSPGILPALRSDIADELSAGDSGWALLATPMGVAPSVVCRGDYFSKIQD